jgi:hypothetical protein
MNTKGIAQIKKEAAIDPRTGNKSFYAALSLLSEGGKEYGLPLYFSGYEELEFFSNAKLGSPIRNCRTAILFSRGVRQYGFFSPWQTLSKLRI